MENVKKKGSTWQTLAIGAKLLLICAIVAGVVSFLYALTAEQYEKNIRQTKNAAIGEIFSLIDLSTVTLPYGGEETVYKVTQGEKIVGYCVEVKSAGFGGDIEMMVGYTADKRVLGVSIIALSETPGLGAKVAEDDFLSQYEGKGGALVLGSDVDAVSGATISSRAVTDGVNRATEALQTALK